MLEMNQPSESLHAPPRILVWLVSVFFFLLIVGTLAGLSFFAGGQRLISLIPFAGIALVGMVVAVIGGAFLFRKSLPRLVPVLVVLGTILFVIVLLGGSIFAYRSVLPPRYQEQLVTEMPFMRAFLPPTPAGGFLPTVAPREGDISPDDLLSAPLLAVTEAVPPTAEPTEDTAALVVLAPSETPLPSATPTAIPASSTPTPIPATPVPATPAPPEPTAAPQQASAVNRPAATRIYGFTYVKQGWNNCGPANITMALSHFGWTQSQEYAANLLKPNTEDKNVSPSEMVAFVREQSGVSAITRIGGDMELLKTFIAANIPVIVETGYAPEGEVWYGHYETVVGYDDTQNVFYLYDSYLGEGISGEGITDKYSAFDARWQAFNRTFIAIYEKDREGTVQQILGDRADVAKANQHALEVAIAEANADRQNAFAWFNMGTAYTKLGDFERGAAAFDRASQLNLPFRMLWYQFGPFEAYFETGRYTDVLALVNTNTANAGSNVEESFFWQGKVYAAQGRAQEAAASFQRALAQNPRYQAARDALNTL